MVATCPIDGELEFDEDHCRRCDKTVHDLREATAAEIQDFVEARAGTTFCARLSAPQARKASLINTVVAVSLMAACTAWSPEHNAAPGPIRGPFGSCELDGDELLSCEGELDAVWEGGDTVAGDDDRGRTCADGPPTAPRSRIYHEASTGLMSTAPLSAVSPSKLSRVQRSARHADRMRKGHAKKQFRVNQRRKRD